MPGPITDTEMASLQGLMLDFLQADVEIYSKSDAENPYSDSGWSYPATPSVVVKGWLRKMPDYQLTDDFAAFQHIDDARLFLPIGTPIERGDKVVVAGDAFTVVDANDHNTWQVTLRVSLRRMD